MEISQGGITMWLFLRAFWQSIFVWHVTPASEGELRSADVIVTQACSRLGDGSPGPGDEILARVAKDLAEKYGLPILAQAEVAETDTDYKWYFIVSEPESAHGLSTKEWNTSVVAEDQVLVCRKKGYTKCIVVAHPDHMLRACGTYKRLGLEVLAAPMPDDQELYQHPGSVQWWYRPAPILGKWRYRSREFACRIAYIFGYL